MKKIMLAVVVVLALTGCGSLEDAAAARDECHEHGGVFKMWQVDGGGYLWKCDLSDEVTR